MQNKDSTKSGTKAQPKRFQRFSVPAFQLFPILLLTGCQVLTYTAPTGERFTRSSLGSTTSLTSLSVVTETNGLRRVELRGYKNDSSRTLGVVTGAAVKAALDSLKP